MKSRSILLVTVLLTTITSVNAKGQETNNTDEYVAKAYDVLGIFVEGVLGDFNELPPVHIPEAGSGLKPSTGYPVVVQTDGTVVLPLIEPIAVKGLTLQTIEAVIREAYTQDPQPILKKARVIVTSMRPQDPETRSSYPDADYRIQSYDILEVYIQDITGEAFEFPPVQFASPSEGFIPSTGYPVLVLPDGTISLPLIEPVPVAGLTIDQVRSLIRKAYTETNEPAEQADQATEEEPDTAEVLPPEWEEIPNHDAILMKNALIIATVMRPVKPNASDGKK